MWFGRFAADARRICESIQVFRLRFDERLDSCEEVFEVFDAALSGGPFQHVEEVFGCVEHRRGSCLFSERIVSVPVGK